MKVLTLEGSTEASVIQEDTERTIAEIAAMTESENPSSRIIIGPASPDAIIVSAEATR